MIPSYDQVLPQLLIRQNLQVTATPTVPRMAALVIGPLYEPHGAGAVPTYAFDSDGQILPWASRTAGVTTPLAAGRGADVASARLYGEGLEAVLAAFNNSTTANSKIFIPDLAQPHIVRMGTVGAHSHFAGSSLSGLLAGRAVRPGDILYFTGSAATAGYTTSKKRRVVSLLGETTASTFGTSATFNDSLAANVSSNPAVQASDAVAAVSVPAAWTVAFAASPGAYSGNLQGASYLGKHGDLFTLTVVTGGAPGVATVNLSSASGLFATTGLATVDESGAFKVSGIAGTNVKLTPPGGTTVLTSGQVFTFSVFGRYERLAFPANLAITGTYAGTGNTTYRIRVITGSTGATATGAVVEISDTAGLEEVSQITITNGSVHVMGALGLSLSFSATGGAALDHGGLRKGDTFMLHARAASSSTVNFDRLVLDAPVVDMAAYTGAGGGTTTALDVEVRTAFTGYISAVGAAEAVMWAADSVSGVTTEAGLSLEVPERTGGTWVPFKTGVGLVSLQFRALVARDTAAGYLTINSLEEITTKLGVSDPTDQASELGFGVWRAFSGAQGRRVYAVNTGGTAPADFIAALARLKHSSEFVYFGVLTDDAAVRALVKDHCYALSAPGTQKVRSAYFGVDSPGEYAYLTTDPATGNAPAATISADTGGAFRLFTHTSATLDFVALGTAPGDLVQMVVGGAEYVVASVVNTQELLLVAGPAAAVVVAEPFQLRKPDSVATQSAAVREAARALGGRRAKVCWTERGTRVGDAGLVEVVPARFVACEIAGLASAVPPQRPLTRVEIETVTNAPNMHARYEPEDLNAVAADGVMVVTQDVPGGPVYIRHQLTTETDKGSLYYEDTATRVMDYLTLVAADTFAPFYGKQNINGRNRSLNEARWLQLLDDASKAEQDDLDGPIIAGYRDARVFVHPTIKDRFKLVATVAIQVPGNTFEIEFNGEIATADA
jgi:hypothetical protein